MPEAANREFWKGLQPIPDCFKPDAKPEVYLHNAPADDERLYVPFTDTVKSRPLWISPGENRWCDILLATRAGLVNRHYHPHEVFAYTISGKWGYLEHDWTATAGDFVYETPGEGHTLVAYEHEEPMRTFFIVKGPLIWLDEQGNPDGVPIEVMHRWDDLPDVPDAEPVRVPGHGVTLGGYFFKPVGRLLAADKVCLIHDGVIARRNLREAVSEPGSHAVPGVQLIRA